TDREKCADVPAARISQNSRKLLENSGARLGSGCLGGREKGGGHGHIPHGRRILEGADYAAGRVLRGGDIPVARSSLQGAVEDRVRRTRRAGTAALAAPARVARPPGGQHRRLPAPELGPRRAG